MDHDGLTHPFEYEHGLNIQDADTDHDGINDVDKLNYWNITRGLDMDTSISYCKIPDVDRDIAELFTKGKETELTPNTRVALKISDVACFSPFFFFFWD